MAQVVQHLVPEPGVQQVQHGVLDAADVQVDPARVARVAAGPIQYRSTSGSQNARVVGRVEVAQLVPARAGPLRHHVQLAPVRPRAVTQVQLDVRPSPGSRQRRLRLGVGVVGIEGRGAEVGQVRQLDRELVVGHGVRAAVRRRRRSGTARPSSAAGRTASPAACRSPPARRRPARSSQSVIAAWPRRRRGRRGSRRWRVDRRPVAGVRPPVEAVRRLDRPDDRQAERLGELPVPLVLPGHAP